MGLSYWSDLLKLLDQLPQLFAQVNTHEDQLARLGVRMATQEQVIARLNTVTNAYAEDTATIRQQLIDLRAALTSGNQVAVSAALDALDPSISGLETMETNLRGLGANPTTPVPDPAPPANVPPSG